MRLPKDILNAGLYTKPNFFLCQTDKEKICKLETTETKGSFKFNSLSEISFETARVYNDIITGETKVNPYYDLIEALRLIYVEGFGYFELQGPELIADGISEKKSCTAYSLEYTLSQKYLENFYINMGTVESKEVLNAEPGKGIVPITLYNPTKPELSLLHLVLEEIYGWKIGHVDSSLRTLSRQFEIDRESVYDFLMNEVCEKFNCYIIFDTINNTINIYAESLTAKFIGDGQTGAFTIVPPFAQIGTVSIDGYKTTQWSYNASTGTLILDDAPESGSHIEIVDGALTEWETDVFVSFQNLAQEVNINYDADSIKTRLTVTYGDDLDIREVNLGLPYLTDISYYYTKGWMGEDLYDAYTKYMQKSNNSQAQYATNSQEILKWNDYIAYEENRLSLEYSEVSVDASTVGTYYTRQENLDGSYYYSEVSLPSEYVADVQYYSNLTTNLNEDKVSDLYTALKSYYNAKHTKQDLNDAIDKLEELQDSFSFMETHTITTLSNALKSNIPDSEKEAEIYAFLHEMWIEVGRTPLKTLYLDSYKKVQETNIKDGWSNPKNENYGLYYPVVLFITSLETTISERDKIIAGYEKNRQVFVNANSEISNGLLMRNNFTEEQLIRLSAFLREDELRLDDIVETSIDDTSSSFKIKQDAMESGKIELQKLCQPQLQFSMTMANIYALSEFEPIVGQFRLGNVIRVALRPDYVKQSRLLQVDINFDDFSDFSCDFGELTSLRTQSDIHADLLSNAISAGKSVATNSSYWTRGSDTATSTDLKIQQGLLDATTQIKAIDGSQGVVIDKYGIKLQKNLANGEVDPHQTWLVNNMILMSDDGFKTSRSALGEITVDGQNYYGLIAEMVLSGYIEGSKIVGGTIQIGEYLDAEGNKKYAFEVDKDGNVTMTSSSLNGYVSDEELKEVIDNTTAEFKVTTDGISSEVQGIKENYATKADMNTAIEQSAEDVLISANKTLTETLSGYPNTADMEAAIKVSADGITDQVSKTYATIGQAQHYGTCSTTAATKAKVVVCSGFTLYTGATISVNFTYANTAASPTLNVNSTGAKTIRAYNSALTADSNYNWAANSIVTFVYDGTYWRMADSGSLYQTNELSSTITQTAADIRAEVVSKESDSISSFGWKLLDNSFTLYSNSESVFIANKDGITINGNGTFEGEITANSGQIGDWNVGEIGSGWGSDTYPNSLYSISTNDSTDYLAFLRVPVGAGSHVFAIRTRDSEGNIEYPFSIAKNGTLFASNAEIEGKITATSGTIGSWNIGTLEKGWHSTNKNYAYNDVLYSTAIPTNDTSNEYMVMLRANTLASTDHIFTVRSRAVGAETANTTFAISRNGAITATAGTIGGCSIVNGVLQIKNANITEKLTSAQINGASLEITDGSVIAGWSMTDNSIYSGTDAWSKDSTFMCTGTRGSYSIGGSGSLNNWVFGAGGKFGVTKSGAVWCSDIHAKGGEIGGCSIVNGVLQIKNANITEKLTSTQIDGSSLNITGGSTIGAWNVGTIESGWGSSTYPDSLWSSTTIGSTDYLAFLRIPASAGGHVFAVRTRDSNGNVTTPFAVSKNGAIAATAGTIGGWTLAQNKLTKGTFGSSDFIGLYSSFLSGDGNLNSSGSSVTSGGTHATIGGLFSENWRIIAGTNFGVTKEGYLAASNVHISGGSLELATSTGNYIRMGGKYNYLSVDTSDFSSTNRTGTRVQLLPTGLQFASGVGNVSTTPIVFSYSSGAFSHRLVGTWYIGALGSSTQVTSDYNKKNTIEDQSAIYSQIFDDLRPVTFKYNDGTSGRTHMGLIAQEVEESVMSVGLTTKEFAPVCYDIDEDGNKTNYGVRYEELVSMCIYEIQKLKQRVAELEAKLGI